VSLDNDWQDADVVSETQGHKIRKYLSLDFIEKKLMELLLKKDCAESATVSYTIRCWSKIASK
jgi:hypothetical protein